MASAAATAAAQGDEDAAASSAAIASAIDPPADGNEVVVPDPVQLFAPDYEGSHGRVATIVPSPVRASKAQRMRRRSHRLHATGTRAHALHLRDAALRLQRGVPDLLSRRMRRVHRGAHALRHRGRVLRGRGRRGQGMHPDRVLRMQLRQQTVVCFFHMGRNRVRTLQLWVGSFAHRRWLLREQIFSSGLCHLRLRRHLLHAE
mmetsp:Transcript_58060/g.123139  ORF Transcript_58060/g.123139 Transcript_58060/m.123139 type:complete len:203 (-) Transcript_58060:109-717(-)